MRKPGRQIILGLLPLFLATALAAQKVETVDGVRVVHNEKGGLWGKSAKVSLELVRKIGDIDTEDENVAFNYPTDIAVDKEGNIYVLDGGNTRIQKFGPDGKYLATIGRKGQGPGEFISPSSLDIDEDGNLVVTDTAQSRLHVIIGGGKDVKSIVLKDERIYGLRCLGSGSFVGRASTYSIPMRNQPEQKIGEMRLFRKLDPDGRVTASFGELSDFGENMTNATGNASEFDVDGRDAVTVSFSAQNRIEKYSPDGKLLWRADRPLSYGTAVKKKGSIDRSGGGISMSAPEMNVCSKGIAVDGRGRAWVVTLQRQLKKEEEVQTSMTSFGGRGQGVNNVSIKTTGNTELRTTDAFKLEIFADDGVLLGEIPLTHFVDVIRIAGDRLFLIDRERGVTVYQYRIVEK
ncbi:MAG: NHL repeat-containing protein [Candidatus Aminicenantes bacterium]|nr:NHL repeat-containing protein [Candidatus Aminicenantes bacterium]